MAVRDLGDLGKGVETTGFGNVVEGVRLEYGGREVLQWGGGGGESRISRPSGE